MKRKVPVITQDELEAAVEEAKRDFGRVVDARPHGALTLDEWCAKIGLGRTVMGQKMREAVADGKYERLTIIAKDAAGRTFHQPVYRKVKNAVDRVRG